MKIKQLKKHIEWEKYYDPSFNWNLYGFYERNRNKLSEDFIREFKDKVDWSAISIYQKLSEDFIREFANKVNWYWIPKYQKLSPEFREEFKDKLTKF